MMTDLLRSFLQLLQFLQYNLTGFKELHILNFRNGSVIVNNKMKLVNPVVDNMTKAVHFSLDGFSNAASKTMNVEIDTESGEEVADFCITNKSYMTKGINLKVMIFLLAPLQLIMGIPARTLIVMSFLTVW